LVSYIKRKHRQRLLENRALRKMFEPKRVKIIGDGRKI
jgi:hypothetical protein